MLLGLVVAVRIIANPFSNVFQKWLTGRGVSATGVVCATHGLLSLLCLPVLCFELPPLTSAFWGNMAIGAVLTVVGNVLIVQAVKMSDLSVLGPINAYKSVVSLVPGMLWLQEYPGPMGLAGIGLIIVGSYFVVDRNVAEPERNAFVRFFRDRGIQYRFAALVLSAIEAVFFKRALLASTPLTAFVGWCMLGFGLSLFAVYVLNGSQRRRDDLATLQTNRGTLCWLVLTTGLMQLCTSYTLAGMQVGYALALFQTSTLISVVLGHTLFQERHFWERLLGSLIMIAGAMLIILFK